MGTGLSEYEAVIGVEVHAELQTRSKMFCACPVIEVTEAEPNRAVCPVCAGMPGMLPVVNKRAVEYGLRVALALECQVNPLSIFARKNYFYPDLPKGYQISQYEQPLARHGKLKIDTSQGERLIRIRRVHLEEDTGKLTHVDLSGESYSLIDLNRAGVPLLEIVTEPDLHTPEEVRLYAQTLRQLLRYVGVNSGDMQKGVLRIEPNISIRKVGNPELGTRSEVKNLNSFRALERATSFEINRQIGLLHKGERVIQETRGWDDVRGETVLQRTKEEADDYRYFPEPDLPPLVVEADWIERIRQELPELPANRQKRFVNQYGLSIYDTSVLVAEKANADYFEAVLDASATPKLSPKMVANWIMGDLFGLLTAAGADIEEGKVSPQALADLLAMLAEGEINQPTAKLVLAEMINSGESARNIVNIRGLGQVSDIAFISTLVKRVLDENPDQVATYLNGKETVSRWLFGQVMRQAGGKANPTLVQAELEKQLIEKKHKK
jgi:aspartyl-tRNA(Asn)/glutamyl-tRNA(Gln) amidotransferase subunit B